VLPGLDEGALREARHRVGGGEDEVAVGGIYGDLLSCVVCVVFGWLKVCLGGGGMGSVIYVVEAQQSVDWLAHGIDRSID
jgi:hypothetical protein